MSPIAVVVHSDGEMNTTDPPIGIFPDTTFPQGAGIPPCICKGMIARLKLTWLALETMPPKPVRKQSRLSNIRSDAGVARSTFWRSPNGSAYPRSDRTVTYAKIASESAKVISVSLRVPLGAY